MKTYSLATIGLQSIEKKASMTCYAQWIEIEEDGNQQTIWNLEYFKQYYLPNYNLDHYAIHVYSESSRKLEELSNKSNVIILNK